MYSNEDCDTVFSSGFPRDFWIRVGVTSVAANAPFAGEDEVILEPTGRGYLANKNKIIGVVSAVVVFDGVAVVVVELPAIDRSCSRLLFSANQKITAGEGWTTAASICASTVLSCCYCNLFCLFFVCRLPTVHSVCCISSCRSVEFRP